MSQIVKPPYKVSRLFGGGQSYFYLVDDSYRVIMAAHENRTEEMKWLRNVCWLLNLAAKN
jgi:hypothetical protein